MDFRLNVEHRIFREAKENGYGMNVCLLGDDLGGSANRISKNVHARRIATLRGQSNPQVAARESLFSLEIDIYERFCAPDLQPLHPVFVARLARIYSA
jgi:hypothetical protein